MAGGLITTGSLPKLLWPGLHDLWGRFYNKYEKIYPKLFNTTYSDKAYEEYQEVTGFTFGQVKPQGQSMAYDSVVQGFTTRLINTTYALGYIVTMEEIQDNLYPKESKSRTTANSFSMLQAKEQNLHLIYNRAFNGTYIGADGVALCSTAHPFVTGGTYANKPTVDADLSEASLEDALISIRGYTDAKGLFMNVKAISLVVPRQELYNAIRLTKSIYQPGTANNDINASKWVTAVPEGFIESVYLTAPHSWFLRTDAAGDGHGLIYQERMSPEFAQDNDFDTKNFKAGTVERYAGGWDNPHSIFGVQGP
jgi:hypothetical protein